MAADYGNAILSGLLGGLGGFGQQVGGAAEAQRQEALKREQLAIEQQRADQLMTLQQNQLAQQQRQFEATQAQHAADRAPIAIPESLGGGEAVKDLLPFLFAKKDAEAKRMEDASKLAAMQGAILNQPARPDVPMPAEGAMYSEAETLPGKPATSKNALLAAIIGSPNADAILKQMFPEDAGAVWHAPPGSTFGRGNTVLGTVPAAPKDPTTETYHVPTADGIMEVTKDKGSGAVISQRIVGGLPPHPPKDPTQPSGAVIYNKAVEDLLALRRAGVPETDPRVVEASSRVNMLKPVMIAEGGSLGGAGGGAPLASGGQRPPSASERTKLSELDASIAAFSDLAKQARSPEVTGALGLTNAPKRFLEDTLKIPTLTEPERAFRAQAAIQLMTVRKSLLGTQQTQLERAGLLPALPSENDPAIATKLEAWVQAAQRNRGAIEATLGGLNIKTPGAPKKKDIYFDAQGNPVQ